MIIFPTSVPGYFLVILVLKAESQISRIQTLLKVDWLIMTAW